MFIKLCFLFSCIAVFCNETRNQTDDLSPILSQDALHFTINIEQANFQLPPEGLQTFAVGIDKGEWLLVSGRTNGLHGFGDGTDNLPARFQNTRAYVVNPKNGTTISRSFYDPSSGLTQEQIDAISATAVQFYQAGTTLYINGGYGVDTQTGQFSTKPTLSAIDIPGLIHWVKNGEIKKPAAKYIRQTSHPLLQVTGGVLFQANPHSPFLLIFGQNFDGFYTDNSSGIYTEQVRPFQVIDDGNILYVQQGNQLKKNPDYHRRDLNVIPIIQESTHFSFIALSGVFTKDEGVYTVPVFIDAEGKAFMPDPTNPNTFKQGMNNYFCAYTNLYSKKSNKNHILLYGGFSYLFLDNGSIQADPEIPFINTVSAIVVDGERNVSQYLMDNQYPTIIADFGQPPNQSLIFGVGARFIPAENVPLFPNDIISYDELGSSTLLGYIVGGIDSIARNTVSSSQSAASPYIFTVTLQKR